MKKSVTIGGAVPTDGSAVLIETAQFERAFRLLDSSKGLAIHGARQVGKTTLMHWLAMKSATRAVFIDLNLAQPMRFNSAVMLLAERIVDELHLAVDIASATEADHVLKLVLREALDPSRDDKPLLLNLDEVDSVLHMPAAEAQSFLLLLRALVERYPRKLKVVTTSLFPLDALFSSANITGNVVGNLPPHRVEQWRSNDSQVIDGLMESFEAHWRGPELRRVLAEMISCTGGHPGTVNHLCLELAHLRTSPGRPPMDGWVELRRVVLSPKPTEVDPIAGYLSNLEPQLLALGARFFIAHRVLRQLIKREPIPPEDLDGAKLLADAGIVEVDASSIPRWAAPVFEQRFSEAWLARLERTASSQVTSLRAKSSYAPLSGRTSRRRVLLLTMGGTIGMAKSSSDGFTSFQGVDQVLEEFEASALGHLANIETRPLQRLDGINVQPEHWIGLARTLNEAREKFDAFVITHGTDTLAYTASAVSYMLGPAFGKPVVFTGAQTTMDVLWGDARANLTRAVLAGVAKQAIPEVQVVFGDQVLRAVRAVKDDDRLFQAFTSPATVPLARITEGFLRFEGWTPLPGSFDPYQFHPYAAEEILFISISPGASPSIWLDALMMPNSRASKTRGIILSTPGAGSLPSVGNYSFMPLIEWAVARDIPVLVISQMPINAYSLQQYAVANEGIERGAIPAGNMTLAAAYTKFSWAIGRADAEMALNTSKLKRTPIVKKIMLSPYVGEQDAEVDVNPFTSTDKQVH